MNSSKDANDGVLECCHTGLPVNVKATLLRTIGALERKVVTCLA